MFFGFIETVESLWYDLLEERFRYFTCSYLRFGAGASGRCGRGRSPRVPRDQLAELRRGGASQLRTSNLWAGAVHISSSSAHTWSTSLPPFKSLKVGIAVILNLEASSLCWSTSIFCRDSLCQRQWVPDEGQVNLTHNKRNMLIL